WLDAPVETLTGRLGATGDGRPLLAGGVAERLARLRDDRQAIYAGAHVHVSTDGLTAEEVADCVDRFLAGRRAERRGAGPPAGHPGPPHPQDEQDWHDDQRDGDPFDH